MTIPNPLGIAEGYVNLALKKVGLANGEVELLAERREAICRTKCKQSRLEPGTTALNENERCTLCNCKMPAKWRSINERCPAHLW